MFAALVCGETKRNKGKMVEVYAFACLRLALCLVVGVVVPNFTLNLHKHVHVNLISACTRLHITLL